MNKPIVAVFDSLIQTLCPAFHRPSAENFELLVTGLVLSLGRPTVRNLRRAASNWLGKHESAFYRFFSRAVWSPERVAALVFDKILRPWVCPSGPLQVAGDDTTTGKTGRKVAFAGWFRNAVASTPSKTVTHWAHNWVVLSLLVPCPGLPTRYLHLPLLARLYRPEKKSDAKHPFRTRHELLIEMLRVLVEWAPGRQIEVVADGAYASKEVVGALPEGVVLVSRLRKDAKLYDQAPPRTGRAGRPAEKGKRLPTPQAMAPAAAFTLVEALTYGRLREVLVYSRVVIWYHVSKQPLRLVIVRDPTGEQPDDYFFTTELGMSAGVVATRYAARWGIEEMFRELKQSLGLERVQCWSARAVERQVPFIMVVHVLVQASYFQALGRKVVSKGQLPSFGRMLTRLRLALWSQRISEYSIDRESKEKILDLVESMLLTAA